MELFCDTLTERMRERASIRRKVMSSQRNERAQADLIGIARYCKIPAYYIFTLVAAFSEWPILFVTVVTSAVPIFRGHRCMLTKE
jgi:hypothetical protein